MREKMSESLGILFSLTTYIPNETLASLYFSLMNCYLCCGITSWGGASPTNLLRVQKIYFSKICFYENIYKVLSLENLCSYFYTVKFHRCFNYQFAVDFNNLQTQHDHNNGHNANSNINVSFYSLSRCHQSLTYNASKISQCFFVILCPELWILVRANLTRSPHLRTQLHDGSHLTFY